MKEPFLSDGKKASPKKMPYSCPVCGTDIYFDEGTRILECFCSRWEVPKTVNIYELPCWTGKCKTGMRRCFREAKQRNKQRRLSSNER